ncbi:unnamed protein product [Rotaria sp. Silwood2]|nr:unnamed protein product [Rotaria sp. Silwood2]CAF2518284.1 unnamed protein product [Rotaria sp. Silwood2]CAF4113589.1 unnamed protein product [Rotaria sp. Silwood2]
MAFLQDDEDDLRPPMETTIDMNAIRAMSYFQNQDFDGLKVARRKMTDSQATGEELDRSISCGWDMETFDMLATVETLKEVSKRILTRIHNVESHASWSGERAAISQVATLYQSENREVPFLPGHKFVLVQHSVGALTSVLLYIQPNFNNQSTSSAIDSNWTVIRIGAARLNTYQITTTNVISLGELFQLRKQYLLTGLAVDIDGKPFLRKNVSLDELLIGKLLDFSTLTCPNLTKTWFRFVEWTYI